MAGNNILLDLIYPKRCAFCGEVRPFKELEVCETCLDKVKKVTVPRCLKCGKTIEDEEEEYCRDCEAIPKSFDGGFPVFFYEGAVKNALYEFKYNNQRVYASFFGECIDKCYGTHLRSLDIDGIVPVPVHPHKKRLRGYNQAEILAKEIGRRMQLPIYPNYLVRKVDTNPQKELNDVARMKNLKNAFKIGENTVKLKKILLVDDIYTSGATIEACTQVLKKAGVENIYYNSVAIGKGYSE